MDSDSKVKNRGIQHSNESSRLIVLEELHRLKENLTSTPFPYCELDCPWLTVCLEIHTSECIISLLLSLNAENYRESEDNRILRVQWN